MATPRTIALVPPVTKPPVRPRHTADLCPSCNQPVIDNVDCQCAA